MVAYSFKSQFIGPIRVGLGIKHLNERGKIVIPGPIPKLQMIRAIGKRRHARPGEVLQLYYAMRTKQCMMIGVARCLATPGIRIFVNQERVEIEAVPHIDESERIITSAPALDGFARSDGFGDWAEMRQFWIDEHNELVRLGPFVGALIRWEPIR